MLFFIPILHRAFKRLNNYHFLVEISSSKQKSAVHFRFLYRTLPERGTLPSCATIIGLAAAAPQATEARLALFLGS
jgi:hypothetical protein